MPCVRRLADYKYHRAGVVDGDERELAGVGPDPRLAGKRRDKQHGLFYCSDCDLHVHWTRKYSHRSTQAHLDNMSDEVRDRRILRLCRFCDSKWGTLGAWYWHTLQDEHKLARRRLLDREFAARDMQQDHRVGRGAIVSRARQDHRYASESIQEEFHL